MYVNAINCSKCCVYVYCHIYMCLWFFSRFLPSAYIHMLAQCLPVYVDTKYYLVMNFKLDRFYASTRISLLSNKPQLWWKWKLQSKYWQMVCFMFSIWWISHMHLGDLVLNSIYIQLFIKKLYKKHQYLWS